MQCVWDGNGQRRDRRVRGAMRRPSTAENDRHEHPAAPGHARLGPASVRRRRPGAIADRARVLAQPSGMEGPRHGDPRPVRGRAPDHPHRASGDAERHLRAAAEHGARGGRGARHHGAAGGVGRGRGRQGGLHRRPLRPARHQHPHPGRAGGFADRRPRLWPAHLRRLHRGALLQPRYPRQILHRAAHHLGRARRGLHHAEGQGRGADDLPRPGRLHPGLHLHAGRHQRARPRRVRGAAQGPPQTDRPRSAAGGDVLPRPLPFLPARRDRHRIHRGQGACSRWAAAR